MTYQLDRRTRKDSDRRPISPAEFFATSFPGLARLHGAMVVEAIAAFAAPPLTVEVDDDAWSIFQNDGQLAWVKGCLPDSLAVTLSPEQFSDWVQNQLSLNGFLVARALKFRGELKQVSAWDSLWICLLEGWPAVDASLTFVDRQGRPLDLARAFTTDDDPADIAHFLREAGYLRLKGWLDPADMAAISDEMDMALPQYAEGDGKSWWATLADGSRRCVRMQEFVERSPTTAKILTSRAWNRMRQIIAADDAILHRAVEGRIIEALFKPIGVVSGPSDPTFHRDCHLGRHAYACSRMSVGVAITSTGPDNGSLRVIAGSHRIVMPVDVANTHSSLPVIAVPTEPGDITVHLSCTLHEATPPVIAERRVMYSEIPLAPLEGGGEIDTSVGELREQVSGILRDDTA